jgi:hypothetical protein
MENNKNVWLVSTDERSRLGYLTKKGKEVYKDLRLFDTLMPNILDSENQHIYITSDEEIKKGDWCIYKTGEIIQYLVKLNTDNLKKIILTTDQDLIKDGVQAIDNEFLEWFVKNPTCEEVKFYKDLFQVNQNNPVLKGSTSLVESYKIIFNDLFHK